MARGFRMGVGGGSLQPSTETQTMTINGSALPFIISASYKNPKGFKIERSDGTKMTNFDAGGFGTTVYFYYQGTLSETHPNKVTISGQQIIVNWFWTASIEPNMDVTIYY